MWLQGRCLTWYNRCPYGIFSRFKIVKLLLLQEFHNRTGLIFINLGVMTNLTWFLSIFYQNCYFFRWIWQFSSTKKVINWFIECIRTTKRKKNELEHFEELTDKNIYMDFFGYSFLLLSGLTDRFLSYCAG